MSKEYSAEFKEFAKGFQPTEEQVRNLFDFISKKPQSYNFEDIVYPESASFEFGDGWRFEVVDEEGGIEGGGDEFYFVSAISQNGGEKTYWLTPGWYASHYGREVNPENTHQVEPFTKQVQDWRRASE